MAYKPTRKKGRLIIITGFLCLALLMAAGVAALKKSEKFDSFKEEAVKKEEEIKKIKEGNQKYAYVANCDIKAGQEINADMLQYQEVYTSMESSLFAEQIESIIAKTDIKKGTQLLKTMISEEKVDTHIREQEFNVFFLSDNLNPYDVVDVRILYPNGENYIVLSKKILKGLEKEKGRCFLWLDEQEILLISSAMVDAYLAPGSSLYTTRYVESALQEASAVTYTPSEEIIRQIETNPNILKKARLKLSQEVRKALIARLKEYQEEEKSKEDWESYLYEEKTDAEENGEINNKGEEEDLIYVD